MDLTPGPFLKNTTMKKIILHLFVLEDVVAFDLGCLTASVFTYSASGYFSYSFVVHKEVFLTVPLFSMLYVYTRGFASVLSPI